MSESEPAPEPPETGSSELPETTSFMLTTFADLYRQEVAAEEDVHRTLPFFATALGLVIASLAYAAARLPKWADLTGDYYAKAAFIVSAILLVLAIVEAVCVLVFISRAISRRAYQRIGPEPALRNRMQAFEAFYISEGITGEDRDNAMADDMRQTLLDSYTTVTSTNRDLNQRRYHFRALAASHLVRSLIWALAATTIIFMADKLGILPKVLP
jgi:hypothetical protein